MTGRSPYLVRALPGTREPVTLWMSLTDDKLEEVTQRMEVHGSIVRPPIGQAYFEMNRDSGEQHVLLPLLESVRDALVTHIALSRDQASPPTYYLPIDYGFAPISRAPS